MRHFFARAESELHCWLVTLQEGEEARSTGRRRRDAIVQEIVGAYLGLAPSDVTLSRRCPSCGSDRHGPRTIERIDGVGLSTSSARGLMAVAIGKCTAIGIDIEMKDDRPVEPIAQLLADEERLALSSVTPNKQGLAFHILWTRKEAVTKVFGLGIELPLASFAVSAPFEPAMVVRCPCPPYWPVDLRLFDFAAEDSYVGAIAFCGAASTLRFFRVRGDSIEADLKKMVTLSAERGA